MVSDAAVARYVSQVEEQRAAVRAAAARQISHARAAFAQWLAVEASVLIRRRVPDAAQVSIWTYEVVHDAWGDVETVLRYLRVYDAADQLLLLVEEPQDGKLPADEVLELARCLLLEAAQYDVAMNEHGIEVAGGLFLLERDDCRWFTLPAVPDRPTD